VSAPIELRQRFRKYTLEDAKNGLTPIKLAPAPGARPDLFVAVGIQYRVQRKAFLNGAKTYEWSEWIECKVSLEGYDPDDEQTPEMAAAPA
jgi:hypothetical protein